MDTTLFTNYPLNAQTMSSVASPWRLSMLALLTLFSLTALLSRYGQQREPTPTRHLLDSSNNATNPLYSNLNAQVGLNRNHELHPRAEKASLAVASTCPQLTASIAEASLLSSASKWCYTYLALQTRTSTAFVTSTSTATTTVATTVKLVGVPPNPRTITSCVGSVPQVHADLLPGP